MIPNEGSLLEAALSSDYKYRVEELEAALAETQNELEQAVGNVDDLQLESKIEAALGKAKMDDNVTILSRNVLEALRAEGIVLGVRPE